MNSTSPPDRPYQWIAKAAWLIRLRWVAVAGQLATIIVAAFVLRIPLELGPLLAVIAFTAFTNCWLTLSLRSMSPLAERRLWIDGAALLGAVMVIDLLSLTTLLFFAGGATNPFAVFYLVNLALGAVILPEKWGWSLMAVAVGGLAFVLVFHVEVPELKFSTGPQGLVISFSELGLFVAMTTCALVIILFVKRVIHQLENTQAELRRVEREKSRSEKLEALGTLAGGAAHELATPLSTIAVISNEMSRHLGEQKETLAEDVALIRTEVGHCQTILARMTGRARQIAGEPLELVSVEALIHSTIEELTDASRIDLVMSKEVAAVDVQVPPDSLAQALRGLLQNGLDASGPEGRVHLSVAKGADRVRIVVHDEGPGMEAATLERAGEPFFTTKEPGRGMGLGLFLARSVIERLGGTLQLDSSAGAGVTAVVELSTGNQSSAL